MAWRWIGRANVGGWTSTAFVLGLGGSIATACATGEEPLPGENGGASMGGRPAGVAGLSQGGHITAGAPTFAGTPGSAGRAQGGSGGGSAAGASSGGTTDAGSGGSSGAAAGAAGKGGAASGGSGGGSGGTTTGPLGACGWTSSSCMSKTCEAVCMNLEGGHCARSCNAIITCAKSSCTSTAADPLCVKRTAGVASKCTEAWDSAGGDPSTGAKAALGYFECACAAEMPGAGGSGGGSSAGAGGMSASGAAGSAGATGP